MWASVWALALLAAGSSAEHDRHSELYNKLIKGKKMQMARATFFGTDSTEEFVGVTVSSDGKIAVSGNSWGPPFPSYVPCEVLGSDQPWDVPLRRSSDKRQQGASEDNPNRTGFVVFYSADLKKAERAVRFGWGSADIADTCAMRDGSFVFSGRATRLFRAVTANAPLRKFLPAGTNEWFGPIEYEGVVLPGDVYLARLEPDLKTFRWVWILEGHRNPPSRIGEGKGGDVVFKCSGLKRITADGSQIQTFEGTDLEKLESRFRAVDPKTGSIMCGGSWLIGTGREPWKMPWLNVYTPEGKAAAGYYTWPGPLVGHDDFRQVSDSSVRDVTILPSGDIALTGWSDGGNSVFCNHPMDLQKMLPEVGLGMSAWGAGAQSLTHIVRFSLEDPSDAYHTLWASYLQTMPNSIYVDGIRGGRDGSVVLFGQTGGWVVQTTTDWFRAVEQYLYKTRSLKRTSELAYQPNGWPPWQGIGGRDGYVSILNRTLDGLLWSSATAKCDPKDVIEGPEGYVVVNRCTGYTKRDGRTFVLLDHDVADWPGFLRKLASQGEGATQSGGKRFWERMDAPTHAAVKAWKDKDVPEDLQLLVRDSLDRVLSDRGDVYSADVWPEADFKRHDEKRLLAHYKAGTIGRDERGDFNRRLLERAFPEHIFVCPKSNVAPVLDAIQSEYGGGESDGHIYLIRLPRKVE
jgi:hypothetical protein